ncbi:hypothetical protein JCM10207_000538 [Rhodosporidiobolus poonsookiae]
MCSSSALLFHGFPAKSLSLCVAALVWKTLAKTHLALDLIAARRLRGALIVEEGTKSRVGEVPVEVWELVREWSIWIHGPGDKCLEWLEDEGPNQHNLGHFYRCEWCSRNVLEWVGGVTDLADKYSLDIRTLLASFDLVLAGDRYYSQDGDYVAFDFDGLSPISVPLHAADSNKPSSFPTSNSYGSHDLTEPHVAFLSFSPAVFAAQDTAAARFLKLCKTFPGLEIASPKCSTVLPGAAPAPKLTDEDSKPAKEKKKPRKRFAREVASFVRAGGKGGRAVEPRWLLLHQGYDCSI